MERQREPGSQRRLLVRLGAARQLRRHSLPRPPTRRKTRPRRQDRRGESGSDRGGGSHQVTRCRRGSTQMDSAHVLEEVRRLVPPEQQQEVLRLLEGVQATWGDPTWIRLAVLNLT